MDILLIILCLLLFGIGYQLKRIADTLSDKQDK